jgi:hypothetical protein
MLRANGSPAPTASWEAGRRGANFHATTGTVAGSALRLPCKRPREVEGRWRTAMRPGYSAEMGLPCVRIAVLTCPGPTVLQAGPTNVRHGEEDHAKYVH